MPIQQLKNELGVMAIEIAEAEMVSAKNLEIIKQKKQAYQKLSAQIAAFETLPGLGFEIKKIQSPNTPTPPAKQED